MAHKIRTGLIPTALLVPLREEVGGGRQLIGKERLSLSPSFLRPSLSLHSAGEKGGRDDPQSVSQPVGPSLTSERASEQRRRAPQATIDASCVRPSLSLLTSVPRALSLSAASLEGGKRWSVADRGGVARDIPPLDRVSTRARGKNERASFLDHSVAG